MAECEDLTGLAEARDRHAVPAEPEFDVSTLEISDDRLRLIFTCCRLSAARLRKEAKTAAERADNRCPAGNRKGNGNSQFTNQIGVSENHKLRWRRELRVPGCDIGQARLRDEPRLDG